MTEHERRNQEVRKQFIKEAMKEAFKEYVNEKAQQFGKWSIRTLAVILFASLIYFILSMNGWQRIPTPHQGIEIHD